MFNPECTLCYQDAKLHNLGITFKYQLSTKSSKTDPFRMGTSVRLAANGTSLCPVQALGEYIAVHPSQHGPLFTFQNRKYLTRKDINTALKVYLGMNHVSSHSFRIGAASTAASAGYPRWIIQSLGRWSSDCFRQYIRIPDSTITNVSQSLVRAVSHINIFDPDVY